MSEGLHSVLGVIQLAEQAGMRGGQMVAFEVIVDVNLPVALDDVVAAAGVAESVYGAADLRDFARDGAHDFGEWGSGGVHIDEDVGTPDLRPEFRQADGRAIPVFDAFEFGRAVESSIELISPGVIWTADDGRFIGLSPVQSSEPRCAADVGEGAQDAVGGAGGRGRARPA